MNDITSLPKDEVISHAAELLTNQEHQIQEQQQQLRVLWAIAGLLFISSFLF